MVSKLTRPSITELCEYGGISIPYVLVAQRTNDQNAEAIRQGPEGQRADQQGSIKFKISDFSGGLFKRIGDWTRDGNRYAYNEGLMTHIPGGLYLPYVLTTQTSVTSDEDISGFRAANKRVRALNTALGTNALRYYLATGTKLYTDTSSSNPALTVAKTLTNNIQAMAVVKQNNVAYLALGTDGDTDDVMGIADPIDDIGTTVALINYANAADTTMAIASFPTVGDGFTLYYMKYNGTTGLFYVPHDAAVPATPIQCVNAATRNIPGSLATVTTSAFSPAAGASEAYSGSDSAWATPENIVSSNNSYAVANLAAAGDVTDYLYAVAFDTTTTIPSSARIVGIQVSIEWKESAGSDNYFIDSCQLLVDGSTVGVAKSSTTEATIADATVTLGGTADTWGTNLTGADLPGLSVRIVVDTTAGADPGDVSIDHVTVTFTYRLPGSGIQLPVGGWSTGPLPSNSNRWPLILPTVDEETTILTPRELWFADISYDAEGDRPVVTLSKVNTGLSHVEAAVPHLGGLAVAGDTSSGVGKSVKLIDANGNVRDLGFLSQDGYETAVGVVSLISAGRVLIADVADEDGGDSQWWYYFDGTWHASTPLQSKSAAIAALPLAWAETAINVNQQYRYRIFPNSTDTAVAREFQPRNIFEDPLVNNTTIVKQNTLFIRTPELNIGGPEEANKSLVALDYLGRLVSATGAGSYGSVRVQLDTGGDTTVASAEVDNTFDTAFEPYSVPTSGVSFRTIIGKITIAQGSANTSTPNGVPILFTSAVEWPLLSIWDVFLNVSEINNMHDGMDNLFTLVKDLANNTSTGKVTQRFRWGTIDVPAVFEGMDFKMLPVAVGNLATEAVESANYIPFMTFREVRGTTS